MIYRLVAVGCAGFLLLALLGCSNNEEGAKPKAQTDPNRPTLQKFTPNAGGGQDKAPKGASE